MSNFTQKLKAFLHDPIDKCLDIRNHEERAKTYAAQLGISGIEEVAGPDHIASCMERSLLERGIRQEFNEIRHPLSDEKIQFSISDDEKNRVFQLIKDSYQKYSSVLSSLDDKNKFFYLWRNLQDIISDEAKQEKWAKLIPVFPADTRLPDHAIWEHLKITSAVNASWEKEKKLLLQNNSLFLFTIGPVQSFISQARKTQDFFMGSLILSYLTFIGMKEIVSKYGPTSIIYPDLYRQPLMDWFLEKEIQIKVENSTSHLINIPTIPNRFVAIISETNLQKIKELADIIKRNIKDEIEKIIASILNSLELTEKVIKNRLEEHLANFPEIYWVAIPWRKGDKDITISEFNKFFLDEELKKWDELWQFANTKGEYPPNIGLLYQLLYTTLEKSMGARKNLREFSQSEERGRKCSVCGERNVLFFWERKNKEKFTRYNPEAIDLTEGIDHKFLSDGEGLCGLCFIKRTLELYLEKEVNNIFKDFSFPSTVEIAVSDFKEKAFNDAKKELEDYEGKLKGILNRKGQIILPLSKLKWILTNTVEGEWFFKENLRKEFIKKELNVDVSDEQLKILKDCLKSLIDKIGKPNPYYAVLHLDGDNMGKWLSGQFLPDIENAYHSEVWHNLSDDFKKELGEKSQKKLLSPAIHSSISNALRNYSIEFVKKIVEEEHLGELVYAGGDDVLAFVNLKDLIDVMEKLRFAFSGEIKIENGKIKVSPKNQTGFVEKDGRLILTMGKNATASMGIVIAHYKEPLKIVLNKVFEMEEYAKSSPGKDSFSILLMKKSGEKRIATFKWKYGNSLTTDVLRIVKDMMNDNNQRYISHNFIQKVKREFIKLKDENGHISVSQPVFDEELKRLIIRSYNCKIKDDKALKKKFIEEFYENVKKLFWNSGGNIDNFTNLLEIASFLNKGD